MSCALVYDERFLTHDTGTGHPERPERLRAIVAALRERGLWDRLERLTFQSVQRTWIERLHDADYVDRLFEACRTGQSFIDTPDSAISTHSAEIARLAVGGALAAVDAAMTAAAGTLPSSTQGRSSEDPTSSNTSASAERAFCALRPPGHHAEADRSMGFCLFNNVAVAAEYLLVEHGLERVAIVDWDVHHGNGTQHLFEHRRDVLFISLHEGPRFLYPGTGFATERGVGAGEGYTLNIPLSPGGGDEMYRRGFEQQVLPRLERYRPQFVLISSGFDAADADPLAHMRVTPEGFSWMTREVLAAAEKSEARGVVSLLEGGYDLTRLGQCAAAHVQALTAKPREPSRKDDRETI